MVRAPRFDKYGMKKGAWSVEEDNKLRAFIFRYGHPNWSELPKLAGLSRCGKSCRLRWMNYLRPDIKHGNFTKEEEDAIVALHNKLGNKWSQIAARLPGRSDNEIKNHWHTHLKTRSIAKDHQIMSKNEKVGSFESGNAYNKECKVEKTNSINNQDAIRHVPQLAKGWSDFAEINNQDEVGILLAVLSSSYESPSSSSTSDDQPSPCLFSGSDNYADPSNVTTQSFQHMTEGFWTDPLFLTETESMISSSDKMFSPLGSTDGFISEDSFQDDLMDDVLLWSTMDSCIFI
ncbi:hypothetical protein OSB04_021699 [Centaurea solstitialis]|uniref:Uncharacterized protein n=1 Tax=Centaurea solstitialis TaxID=347529 RepID=A0AA38WI00_9ASTR|nr:hypothetical protein OSB04_021699 [Centaurea solstitialis]